MELRLLMKIEYTFQFIISITIILELLTTQAIIYFNFLR